MTHNRIVWWRQMSDIALLICRLVSVDIMNFMVQVFLERFIVVAELVNKFLASYGIRWFILFVRKAHHLTVS